MSEQIPLTSVDSPAMLCAGVTVYSALRKAAAPSGSWVVILGAGGGLGHLACQIASRSMGLRVIGIDAGSKKSVALESGAEHFIDHTAPGGAEAEVTKLTGGLGAQAVIVCTAANAAYASAIGMLKFGGCLVCVGLPEGELKAIAGASPTAMVFKELTIKGSAVGSRKEAIETLELLQRGLLKTKVRVEKMESLTGVFEEMERGELTGRVVLDLQ